MWFLAVAMYINRLWIKIIFQASEVEETLKRIQSHKGVVGTIVVNAEGNENKLSRI